MGCWGRNGPPHCSGVGEGRRKGGRREEWRTEERLDRLVESAASSGTRQREGPTARLIAQATLLPSVSAFPFRGLEVTGLGMKSGSSAKQSDLLPPQADAVQATLHWLQPGMCAGMLQGAIKQFLYPHPTPGPQRAGPAVSVMRLFLRVSKEVTLKLSAAACGINEHHSPCYNSSREGQGKNFHLRQKENPWSFLMKKHTQLGEMAHTQEPSY